MLTLTGSRLLAAAFATPALHAAQAQAPWPTRPVTLVNPWPAGGSSDTMTRLFAQRFSQTFSQNVVVDNRSGASGTIGHNYVAQQRPDGYVLLSAGHSIAVQNFNENVSVLLMLLFYALLIRLNLPVPWVIALFGTFVSVSMFLVILWYRRNQRERDWTQLIGEPRHDEHHS